jgi:N-acetylglucosaminyl-diphospho-decaprenol L-rhamnosyltransferase
MKVGVVMVTFNSQRHLESSIGELARRALVQVVDNASTDDSVTVARDLGALVLPLPHNIGFGAAANVGAAVLPADVDGLLFLNPDVRLDAESVAPLARAFDDPSVGLAAPRLRFPDGALQLSARDFPSLRSLLGRWRNGFDARAEFVRARPDWTIGAAFMMRRDDFVEIGGFDTRFFLYGEDVDLCCRVRERAMSVVVSDDVTFEHAYERASAAKLNLADGIVRAHWRSIVRLARLYPVDFLS